MATTITNLTSLISDLEASNSCAVMEPYSEVVMVVELTSMLQLFQLSDAIKLHERENLSTNDDCEIDQTNRSLSKYVSDCNTDCFWGRIDLRLKDFCAGNAKGESNENRSDGAFMLTYDNQEIIFKESDLEISENFNEVYICISKISPFARIAKRILLPLFCSTSIVSLIAVVILHALFRELQNLYGICLVGLSVTLMLQTVPSLILYLSDYVGLLFVAQAFGHYLWLCIYSWEVVIIYHVYRSLTVDFVANRINVVSIKRQAMYYVLFATGLPVPFVISGVICHFSAYDFSYNYFNYERLGTVIYLIYCLPVLFLTLIGLWLLFCCMSKIRQVRVNSTLQRRNVEFFFIALRLQLTLGLPWIVIIYGLLHDDPLNIPVEKTVNSLHGCFIMIAFFTTKKVRGLLKRKNVPTTESLKCGQDTPL
ncbi:hypothetical protein HOLleu_24735 [Holothuria leucospilota]|uniref:G-protein coupled receptors family 2 profile 2 domain-containing protein n=1 Tax=Holothuria leucospilota TaxID=206669 RepID=A0A9Q1BRK6_HOLLE|nr:hypothetical protein HOLleu_24735 [Holothuria leucospilota]